MRKIASTSELQRELREILDYARAPRPSRQRIASALSALSDRLITAASSDWKEVEEGATWLRRAQYAGGAKYAWGIWYSDVAGKYGVEVETPDGCYQRKKTFDSLEQAQRFADKFIEKANGHEALADVLESEFKAVNGRAHVSPLN